MSNIGVGAAKQAIRGRLGPRIAARRPRRVDLPMATWRLTVGDNGHLWRDGVDLVELTRRFGSPLHVVDATLLDRAADEALGAGTAREAPGAPRADIFYSYKTNPVPAVLERLHARGVGAEVISPYELWLAMRLGVPAERIIYNGPAKSFDSLCDAARAGVRAINANSVEDIAVIAQAAAHVGVRANLGLRIALPAMWGGQFGIASGSPAVAAAVRACRDDDRVHLGGLHFHHGSALRDEAAFVGHVQRVLAFCDELRARTGWHPAWLDLGGSLACPTVAAFGTKEHRLNRAIGSDLLPPEPSACVRVGAAARLAAARTAEHFAARRLPVPDVVLEPGRSLTAATQLLLATVQNVKTDGALAHAVLDAGMNIAEPISSEYHQLFSASAPAAAAETPYRIVGPICTPADVLYNNWRLPALGPGHVLAIMDTGAYFVPFSTSFSFPRPAIVLQDGSDVRVVRRRESFDDLVSLDDLPPAPDPVD